MPNPPVPEESVEALARFEFDRLERGDLRVKGAPIPWEQAEACSRNELLDWARDALEAAAPAIRKQERERVLGEKARAVVADFLCSWRFCPVSQAEAPARSCLEDAAKQLLAALARRTPER